LTIGGVWIHAVGSGFNIQLESVPSDGRIALRITSANTNFVIQPAGRFAPATFASSSFMLGQRMSIPPVVLAAQMLQALLLCAFRLKLRLGYVSDFQQ